MQKILTVNNNCWHPTLFRWFIMKLWSLQAVILSNFWIALSPARLTYFSLFQRLSSHPATQRLLKIKIQTFLCPWILFYVSKSFTQVFPRPNFNFSVKSMGNWRFVQRLNLGADGIGRSSWDLLDRNAVNVHVFEKMFWLQLGNLFPKGSSRFWDKGGEGKTAVRSVSNPSLFFYIHFSSEQDDCG